jgi:hypothetical protein
VKATANNRDIALMSGDLAIAVKIARSSSPAHREISPSMHRNRRPLPGPRPVTEAEARAGLDFAAGVKGQKPPPRGVLLALIKKGFLCEERVGVAGMGRKLALTALGSLTRIAIGAVPCKVDTVTPPPAIGGNDGGRGNL